MQLVFADDLRRLQRSPVRLSLHIRTAQCWRAGWDEASAAMAKNQDDVLLDEVNTTDWDQSEWEC